MKLCKLFIIMLNISMISRTNATNTTEIIPVVCQTVNNFCTMSNYTTQVASGLIGGLIGIGWITYNKIQSILNTYGSNCSSKLEDNNTSKLSEYISNISDEVYDYRLPADIKESDTIVVNQKRSSVLDFGDNPHRIYPLIDKILWYTSITTPFGFFVFPYFSSEWRPTLNNQAAQQTVLNANFHLNCLQCCLNAEGSSLSKAGVTIIYNNGQQAHFIDDRTFISKSIDKCSPCENPLNSICTTTNMVGTIGNHRLQNSWPKWHSEIAALQSLFNFGAVSPNIAAQNAVTSMTNTIGNIIPNNIQQIQVYIKNSKWPPCLTDKKDGLSCANYLTNFVTAFKRANANIGLSITVYYPDANQQSGWDKKSYNTIDLSTYYSVRTYDGKNSTTDGSYKKMCFSSKHSHKHKRPKHYSHKLTRHSCHQHHRVHHAKHHRKHSHHGEIQ